MNTNIHTFYLKLVIQYILLYFIVIYTLLCNHKKKVKALNIDQFFKICFLKYKLAIHTHNTYRLNYTFV